MPGEALRRSSFCGSCLNQGCASGDAGAAEVAGYFLMDIHGMEQRSRAMQKSDEGQSHGSVSIGLATKLHGEAPLQEFERGHVFLAGKGSGPVFGDEAVVIGMGDKEVQNAAADLHGRARGLDGREKIQAGATTEEGDKIVLVGKTLIESRSRGSRSGGDSAHGQGMFAAPAPHAISGI